MGDRILKYAVPSTFEKGFPESFSAAARHVRSLALSICNAISAIFI
jgi:hypothetical protein